MSNLMNECCWRGTRLPSLRIRVALSKRGLCDHLQESELLILAFSSCLIHLVCFNSKLHSPYVGVYMYTYTSYTVSTCTCR